MHQGCAALGGREHLAPAFPEISGSDYCLIRLLGLQLQCTKCAIVSTAADLRERQGAEAATRYGKHSVDRSLSGSTKHARVNGEAASQD